MKLTVKKIIDTNNGIQDTLFTREFSPDVTFKITRIADILQREALRAGKLIDKLQAEHECRSVPDNPRLVTITKNVEEYNRKANELYDTEVDVTDLTDRIPLSRLRKVSISSKEMRFLMPFVDADVEWID